MLEQCGYLNTIRNTNFEFFRPAAAMHECLRFFRRCLPGNLKPKCGKISDCRPRLRMAVGDFFFCGHRESHVVMTFTQSDHRNPRGSNGNRLFPWHTILLARSSVLYLLRPWAREGMTHDGCGIAYRDAGSGRDRPAHRQRPAAVRKRPGRNLRAMPARRFCSGWVAGGI